jgi:hypothetical protein
VLPWSAIVGATNAVFKSRIESLSLALLLPLFFALTGLRTRIDLLAGRSALGYGLAILAIAVAGKLAGAALAAKVIGVNWKDSFALGVLMNTRGLVELVILNAGLDLGVSSPALFTMMVLMASGLLLLLFALVMSFALGLEVPLSLSVFSASAGAFLLATCGEYSEPRFGPTAALGALWLGGAKTRGHKNSTPASVDACGQVHSLDFTFGLH